MTYTPTTQDMRTVWAVFSENGGLITRTKSTLTDDRLDEFDRWHAEELRKAKAQAWDEGCYAGIANAYEGTAGHNPYGSQS